ncbi:MAG: hypothetical protein JOZ77_09905 [Candidatus Eremiobacteraeota bacterium]|nr:hypothetical protein [Candidatus Eremiobacteraeota bacterium]
MAFSNKSAVLIATGALLVALAACNGNSAVPSSQSGAQTGARQTVAESNAAQPAVDTTSILKKLTKDVVIGTTIDPTNGDMGPRGLSVIQLDYHFKKGQLLVCNFDDKTGAPGKGTTIDLFNPQPSSSPQTVVQSSDIEGCDGTTPTSNNDVYATGLTSHLLTGFMSNGKVVKSYGKPFVAPLSLVDAANPKMYSAEYIFGSDARTGGIISFSINMYGNNKPTEVGSGFDVNQKPDWGKLGPSGLQYEKKSNVLYIADGVDNVIDEFTNVSELLVPKEIVVQDKGLKFACKYPHTTCGKVLFSGAPLNAPVALALLPNGNLIAANTAGGNTLVEISSAGKVLDTKVVDTSSTAGIFGIAASGTSDSNTVLFYTDTNTNTLHELEQ